ncbi:hypothetical protein SERLADRAFT_433460 [Serpula lacrymans var. lacrymans S7.9]|uniref:GAG-pre-integrase domain-containing protein n=1 Tax=Serpula lacrymans var. lacrymans (strain S7.9) TaxID=578457 RepID=F8NHX2_SERL9|nr:uncharacterized protein SERLADRAFT_433460 [Serpula lacrymans var. lacrymans S7.9]EGO29482.1 hypothetical protein SERLADRAFT_433460 [Serpula lacrymans var. lacrymans S7.9]
MSNTLISTSQVDKAGYCVHIERRMCRLLSPHPKCHTIASIPAKKGLYQVNNAAPPKNIFEHFGGSAMNAKMDINKLHRALGHISHSSARKLVKSGMVTGIDLDETAEKEICNASVKAISNVKPFPAVSDTRASSYGECIHSDLWGPASVQDITGKKYMLTFTDDFS